MSTNPGQQPNTLQGTFASSVEGTPAVTASGTHGATGVRASSDSGDGVFGQSFGSGSGVRGVNTSSGSGVFGQSFGSSPGVLGQSFGSGPGVQGLSEGTGLAGEFIGDVSVSGNLVLTVNAFETGLTIANTNTGGKRFALNSIGSEGAAPGSFHITDLDAGASHFIMDSSGNVGIGPGVPQAKLDIAGGATEGVHIANTNQRPYAVMMNNTTFGSTDATGFGLWQGNTGTAVVTNNSNNAISIDSSGNVGIGTTTPSARLEVAGDINVTGDVVLLGADCAEEFDISEAGDIEPGTVMVLDQEGRLHQSQRAYDKRVAGVISGAGSYKPGLILDRQQARDKRLPVALVGKVYCKVDARYASIEVGDLLTTSPTSGHAMKADDPLRAFGAVIGKALGALQSGQGLVPILVALQ